jgi:DNA-binding Lrp family transcriptional regulator
VIAGYVLIQTEAGMAASVVAVLRDVPGVSTAEIVAGPYDVIVRARARSMDQLGRLVVKRIQAVAGVLRTTTCPVISRSRDGRDGS